MLASRTARTARRRRGATIVEGALVMGVFLMLLFGMFEYCRFLMVLHVTNNAARDGARYASVNLDKPATFNRTDFTDAGGTAYTNIEAYTTARLGGTQKQLNNYKVACFAVDSVGLAQTPPVVRPKTLSTGSPKVYPDPFATSDSNAVPWNSAVFTEKIAVTIQGDYIPVLPALFQMPSSIPVKVTAIMGSEG